MSYCRASFQHYLNALKRYSDFQGRTSRRAYWHFALHNYLMMLVLILVDFRFTFTDPAADLGWLLPIYSLAILIPSVAIKVRRLHDIDYRGWWLLLPLIPFLGSLALLVLFCLPSRHKDNRFGPADRG